MASLRSIDYKARGGKLVRVRLAEEEGRARHVRISGDFFLLPEDSLPTLETMLEGAVLHETGLRKVVDSFFEMNKVESLGISRDDLVQALLSTREEVAVAG